MTADERRQAILALIAAEVVDAAAEQQIKRSYIAQGRVSFPAVVKVLRGRNYTIKTLIEIADSMDCDLEVHIQKRSA